MQTIAAALAALAASTAAYFLLIRPWHRRWNCLPGETLLRLPGDGIVARPSVTTDRAIEIQAPPERVWPWLAQMGEGRGGFYSYDWIDRLLGFDINSTDRIHPEFQEIHEGGVIPRGMHIWAVEPGRHLVVGTPPGMAGFQSTWAMALVPKEGGCRLLSRVRIHYDRWTPANLFMAAILDPGQFIMEQKWLRGVRDRAEGRLKGGGASPGPFPRPGGGPSGRGGPG